MTRLVALLLPLLLLASARAGADPLDEALALTSPSAPPATSEAVAAWRQRVEEGAVTLQQTEKALKEAEARAGDGDGHVQGRASEVDETREALEALQLDLEDVSVALMRARVAQVRETGRRANAVVVTAEELKGHEDDRAALYDARQEVLRAEQSLLASWTRLLAVSGVKKAAGGGGGDGGSKEIDEAKAEVDSQIAVLSNLAQRANRDASDGLKEHATLAEKHQNVQAAIKEHERAIAEYTSAITASREAIVHLKHLILEAEYAKKAADAAAGGDTKNGGTTAAGDRSSGDGEEHSDMAPVDRPDGVPAKGGSSEDGDAAVKTREDEASSGDAAGGVKDREVPQQAMHGDDDGEHVKKQAAAAEKAAAAARAKEAASQEAATKSEDSAKEAKQKAVRAKERLQSMKDDHEAAQKHAAAEKAYEEATKASEKRKRELAAAEESHKRADSLTAAHDQLPKRFDENGYPMQQEHAPVQQEETPLPEKVVDDVEPPKEKSSCCCCSADAGHHETVVAKTSPCCAASSAPHVEAHTQCCARAPEGTPSTSGRVVVDAEEVTTTSPQQ